MGIGSFKYELSSQTPQGRACNTIFITNSSLQVKQILFNLESFASTLIIRHNNRLIKDKSWSGRVFHRLKTV